MKLIIKKITLLVVVLVFLFSCDTNDNNDPDVPCNGKFFLFEHQGDATTIGDFNVFGYQKQNGFGAPNQMLVNNENFLNQAGHLRYTKSTIDPNSNTFAYKVHDMLITYNMNANTVAQTIFNAGDNPEYVNGSLYLLKTNSIISGTNLDVTVIDDTGANVSSNFALNIPNSGLNNSHEIRSTTDGVSKIFYLGNTYLFTYDVAGNTMSSVQFDSYVNPTHKIWYFGLEYVDVNTLYVLKGDATDFSVKLIKIDITNPNAPVLTIVKDLTNATLGFTPYNMVNGNAYMQSDYDSCDDSYYFTYTNPNGANADSHLVELKLISNVINTFPSLNGVYYLGLDHYN